MQSIWDVADIAIRELNSIGYLGACFVGGVACTLHGNVRTPKDLDILIVNTSDTQATIKQKLAARNRFFYLVPSRKIGQTYKVLWYDQYQYNSFITPTRESPTSIKVDILLPGIMDIPPFDNRYITYIKSPIRSTLLPVAPLSVTLLLKLQAWSQHRAALDSYYSKEQYKDQRDLECIVPIAARHGIKPQTDPFLSNALICKLAESRIKEYLGVYPDSTTRASWSSMGFVVPAKIGARSTTNNPPKRTQSALPNLKSPSKATPRNPNVKKYNVKPLPKVKPVYSRNNYMSKPSTTNSNKAIMRPAIGCPIIPQIKIPEVSLLGEVDSQVITTSQLVPKKESTTTNLVQVSGLSHEPYLPISGGWWH